MNDALTGAWTRSNLDQDLSQLVQRAQADASAFSLVFFDLDHFKAVNDAFGHQAGDEALRAVAGAVQQCIRENDTLYRYGGDEFVMLLPGVASASAHEICERLLADVSAIRIPRHQSLALSISVGIAQFPNDGTRAEELIAAADRRNYQAKRSGRARVVSSDAGSVLTALFSDSERLYERDDALATARQFLKVAATSGHTTLVVEGGKASGRSRFLRHVLHEAQLRGVCVISVTAPTATKSTVRAGLLEGIKRVLDDRLLGAHSSEVELAAALARYVQDHQHTGLLFSIDDTETLDWTSVRAIQRYLVQTAELGLPPISVMYSSAVRSGVLIQHTFSAGAAFEVLLQPLSQAAVQTWLRTVLHWDPPAQLLEWLIAQSGGLPGRIEAALRQLTAMGGLTRRDGAWTLHHEIISAAIPDHKLHKHVSGKLPVANTSFIEREGEFQHIAHALGQHRIVTLAGVGGTGKTRLALHSAHTLAEQYEHGACWVDLAGLAVACEPEQVHAAIADAVGVQHRANLLNSLCQWLSEHHLLMVIDNCEHVIESVAPVVERIAQTAPRVTILCTTREALRCNGEHVVSIQSLTMPVDHHALDFDELAQYPASRLFMERASVNDTAYEWTQEDARAVAQICSRLDGIPLAIELAAARTNALSPRQIAPRLENAFRLLTGGVRTALPRQRTLYSLIEWSYTLLSTQEQVLFRRLSVFTGSASLAQIEQTCSDAQLESYDVVDVLCRLVDKSLVIAESDRSVGKGPKRYRMLMTIAQFADEKLAAVGEKARVQQCHLDGYLTLVEAHEPLMSTHAQAAALDIVAAELDNIRAALLYAKSVKDLRYVRLASALWRYWDLRGGVVEGYAWLTDAIATVDQLNAADDAQGQVLMNVHALALARAAYLVRNLENYAQAKRISTQAASVALACGNTKALAMAKFIQGAATMGEAGLAHLREAKQLFLEVGLDGYAGTAQVFIGVVAEQGNDLPTAQREIEAALPLLRDSGEGRRISHGLARLGLVQLAQGLVVSARHSFKEILVIANVTQDSAYLSNSKYLLGRVALYQDDYVTAREWLTVDQLTNEETRPAERAWALLELARTEWADGATERASAIALTATRVANEAQLPEIAGYAKHQQALVAIDQMRFGEAITLIHSATQAFEKAQPIAIALCLEAAAWIALKTNHTQTAAELMGCRSTTRSSGYLLDHYPYMERARYQLEQSLMAQLGEAQYRTAFEVGKTKHAKQMIQALSLL